MFGSILKMLFSYKFFTFSRLFSQHPNKFYYKKFQNHSQIPIHGTNHSQIPTPHTTETPIQPTAANYGNQNKQPPKQHYHTTTTTTKIKITERDRQVEGEIARRRDQAARCDLVHAIIGLELEVRRQRRRHDLGSLFSLSLFARLTRKWFEVKILASNHFRGQSLIFTVNFK